jgi:hypothetical protein
MKTGMSPPKNATNEGNALRLRRFSLGEDEFPEEVQLGVSGPPGARFDE